MKANLRFAPDVLRRLGEELNPSPEQGILELVRNAYDADASRCTVSLKRARDPGGKLMIADNGGGMTPADLRDAWLVLGRSPKQPETRTEKHHRLQVGSKGLGRLAALRLGHRAELRTRPASERGVEYRVTFDWDRFDRARTVDRVPLEITQHETSRGPGTTVDVQDLKRGFTTAEVTRIARALVLISSPFKWDRAFRPRLSAPEFKELEELVKKGYWSQAAYEIRGWLNDDGSARAEMVDHERRRRRDTADHSEIRREKRKPPYEAPAATFELYVFRLSGDASTRGRTSGVTLTALRQWLGVVGGVHLYHRGLRVYPYGDAGHDWLDMNLRRAASPEERPSTNNSVGRVVVLDEDAVLQQKTDRTGFIETEEFVDLRRFAQDVLRWAATTRLREAEKRRKRERKRAEKTLAAAQSRMSDSIAGAPAAVRKDLKAAQDALKRATERELTALRVDLDLYRTLATIGTTTAVMAHESFNPPNTIVRLAGIIRKRGRRLLRERYGEALEEPVDLIEENARRISTFVTLPRELLDRGKRRRGRHSINAVTAGTLKLLRPLLDEHQIEVESDFDPAEPRYLGTVAAFESIVANLVINSVGALDASKRRQRLVRVRTVAEDGRVMLDVADNGPGIRNIKVNEIWLPGRSTTDRGVGLGLTIVHDIVTDLNGEAHALAKGDLGGAQFTIEIPRVEAS